MSQTHFSGPLVQGTDARPSASTNVLTARLVVAAAASFSGAVAAAGAITGTTVTPSTGYGFVAGDKKLFACGTYIGAGAATAAITNTGLTTIHHVFMQLRNSAYGSAATSEDGRIICAPCIANGTRSKFYPRVYKSGATNKEVYPSAGKGATFSWFAVGV